MARIELPQSRVRARRKRRRIRIAYLCAAALLILLIALVALAHAPFLRITGVDVSGESTLNGNAIASEVMSDISGSYLYVFPKDNIFLYPKYRTQADLEKQMPTIAKVSIQA